MLPPSATSARGKIFQAGARGCLFVVLPREDNLILLVQSPDQTGVWEEVLVVPLGRGGSSGMEPLFDVRLAVPLLGSQTPLTHKQFHSAEG